MIPILITTLNVFMIALVTLGFIAVILMVMIVVTDLTWYRELVAMDLTVLRDKRTQKAKNKADEKEMLRKEALRREKELSAHKSFFEEERYVPGFNREGSLIYRGHKVPTNRALDYYQRMDKLADTQVFDNIEVL